jgi:hypothetical protein
MRPLMLAFLILSPFIALAQNYHWRPLGTEPATHLARAVVYTASMQMSEMVRAVQSLLT